MLEADFSTARYSALIFISLAGLELPLLESGVSLLIKGFSLCFFFHILFFFFPFQIANILDSHAATLNRKSEREVFFMNTQSIVQLVQR